MKTCKHQKTVEAWFDGEYHDTEWLEAHLAGCVQCRDHHELLGLMRAGVQHNLQVPQIAEPQFSSFMEGITEGIERQPRNPFRGFWAYTSLVTAALVIVMALSVLFLPSSQPVEATEIQTVYTEYDGATVDWYPSEDGSTTIWIKTSKDDLE